ncbi:MAG: helix-turn-helix transcriptional regulator [Anaerolineae bacterium]
MKDVVVRQIQATRRQILMALKKRGGMTADELGKALGITPMGVRRHLTTLERDGLVTYETAQRGVGRPSYVYSLTDLADELFPKNYHQLANEILDIIAAQDGEDKVELVFAQRAQRLAQRYGPRLAGKDLEARIAELASIQEENGYLAEWEKVDEDTFLLKEHNCAVSGVARRFPQACVYELALFTELLDAEVTREKHMASGDIGCYYRIRRR